MVFRKKIGFVPSCVWLNDLYALRPRKSATYGVHFTGVPTSTATTIFEIQIIINS